MRPASSTHSPLFLQKLESAILIKASNRAFLNYLDASQVSINLVQIQNSSSEDIHKEPWSSAAPSENSRPLKSSTLQPSAIPTSTFRRVMASSRMLVGIKISPNTASMLQIVILTQGYSALIDPTFHLDTLAKLDFGASRKTSFVVIHLNSITL